MNELLSKIMPSQETTFNTTSFNNSSLLQDQKANQEKINELLEKSANAMICGPSCQRQKTIDSLKQKYIDAETNVKMGPAKVEETKKNYYTYSEGPTYYADMKERELKETVDKLAEMLKEAFNNEVSNAKTMNSYLNTAITNSERTIELLEYYKEENLKLEKELKNSSGDILTNDRKTYYETEATTRLKSWYSFFWYIYYLLVLVLLLAYFLATNDLSLPKKVIIFVAFLFYPYYISVIINSIWEKIMSIYNNLPKNVYNNL